MKLAKLGSAAPAPCLLVARGERGVSSIRRGPSFGFDQPWAHGQGTNAPRSPIPGLRQAT